MYATIIALDELLVNQSKSSTKVVLSRNHEINILTDTEEKHMLEKLLHNIKEMFTAENYHSKLERYIVNHNPQTAADVEHWERQYHYEQQRQGVV